VDVTRAGLEALATKLRPHVQELSEDEVALLNHAFDCALADDDGGPEVAGFDLSLGWFSVQLSPPVRTTGGGGTSTPPTTSGGTVKSASFDPATVKFPSKPPA
jgi:hypothetical protein